MTDEHRIDLSASTSPHAMAHLRGYFGDDGESEGVLCVHTYLDKGNDLPECARIIVGSPTESSLIDGYIPKLGGFSCSPDAADRLADELRGAAAAARAAIGQNPP